MISDKFRTIEEVVKSKLCLHCGTCMVACLSGCIDQGEDQYGNPVPKIGTGCEECGQCIKVCPGIQSDQTLENECNHVHSDYLETFNGTFVGRARSSILSGRLVASGGIVSAIASQFFETHPNGLVQWVSLSQNGKPTARLLNHHEFKKSDGDSVYIPSFANRAFLDSKNQGDEPILAIGLPCQIQGLELLKKHNRGLRERVRCKISLFCGLSISTNAVAFLLKKSGHCIRDVDRIRFRTSMGLTATLKNGKKIKLEKNSVNYTHMIERCAFCSDHTGELSDISCGDAWLSSFSRKSGLSWSVVITRSAVGMHWLRSAIKAKWLWAMRIGPEDVITSQRPMLHFKKRTLKQRYSINTLLLGQNPKYRKSKLQFYFSPRTFIGSLVLISHLRLSRIRIYKEFLTRFIPLAIFNRFIKFCLYLDVDYLFRSYYNQLTPICSRIKTIPYFFLSFRMLKRKINDNASVMKRPNRFKGLGFTDNILHRWRRQFPESAEQIFSGARDSMNGNIRLFDRVYNVKKYGWNASPLTHLRYPDYVEPLMGLWFRKFCKVEQYGDEKYAFELHKHYFFLELALAYRLTGEKSFAVALYDYIKSWRKNALPNAGIGWFGNVHVAQRMVAWIITFLILKNDRSYGSAVCDELGKGLKEHACILQLRYDYPANNHMIGSLCALIIYEFFQNKTGKNDLLKKYFCAAALEIERQINDNGSPMEGSLAYGRLVYEFFLLVIIFAEDVKFELPEIIMKRTKAMTEWYRNIIGPETAFPPIGDRSDERAFPFREYLFHETDCLVIGQRIFNLHFSGSVTPLSWLLLESSGLGLPEKSGIQHDGNSSFIDTAGGYGRVSTINGKGLWTVWMRAGNFGFPPKYGHAHSDFLAPIIYCDGKPVITEYGTFQYNLDTKERLKDVLSEGHSGIRYDIFEQNFWHGTFKWGKSPLQARIDASQKGLRAWMKMQDNSVVDRKIDLNGDGLIIEDRLQMDHPAERLTEWSFIFDAVLLEDSLKQKGALVFRLRGDSGRIIQFIHDGVPPNDVELRPARISTSYGVSHDGYQAVFRRLLNHGGTWFTKITSVTG